MFLSPRRNRTKSGSTLLRSLAVVGFVFLTLQGSAQLSVTGQLEATSFTGTGINISGVASFNSLTVTGVTGIPGTLIGVRYLTSGTSYVPTAGTKSIVIELVGGGGGGGGTSFTNNTNSAAGSGGGSGAYLMERIASISGTYTIQIGTGGTAGSNAGGNGGNGSATFFVDGATTYNAPPGSGGIGMTFGTVTALNIGGAGGVISTNADINAGGSAGAIAIRLSGTQAYSGNGGSSRFGSGGSGRAIQGQNPGLGNGAGGGGGCSLSAATAGGIGTAGIIVIHEYR